MKPLKFEGLHGLKDEVRETKVKGNYTSGLKLKDFGIRRQKKNYATLTLFQVK